MAEQQSIATGRLALDDATVQDFAAGLRGEVLRPDDEGYDETRKIHNGMIDRRPTLIARCAGVADVIASVQFAREQHLLVSVRCGGHSVPGFSVSDGGLMIDLSPMRGVRVDAARRTVRAEGGVTWGTSITRRRPLAWQPLAGWRGRPASPALRSAAAMASSCASTASPAITSCRLTWLQPRETC